MGRQAPAEGDGFTYEHLSEREELWVDFMADTGDGGDPTYAVARALAAPQLPISAPTALGSHHASPPRSDGEELSSEIAEYRDMNIRAAWHDFLSPYSLVRKCVGYAETSHIIPRYYQSTYIRHEVLEQQSIRQMQIEIKIQGHHPFILCRLAVTIYVHCILTTSITIVNHDCASPLPPADCVCTPGQMASRVWRVPVPPAALPAPELLPTTAPHLWVVGASYLELTFSFSVATWRTLTLPTKPMRRGCSGAYLISMRPAVSIKF